MHGGRGIRWIAVNGGTSGSKEKLEEWIRRSLSELVKGDGGQGMIRYQLTELARALWWKGYDAPTANPCHRLQAGDGWTAHWTSWRIGQLTTSKERPFPDSPDYPYIYNVYSFIG